MDICTRGLKTRLSCEGRNDRLQTSNVDLVKGTEQNSNVSCKVDVDTNDKTIW